RQQACRDGRIPGVRDAPDRRAAPVPDRTLRRTDGHPASRADDPPVPVVWQAAGPVRRDMRAVRGRGGRPMIHHTCGASMAAAVGTYVRHLASCPETHDEIKAWCGAIVSAV